MRRIGRIIMLCASVGAEPVAASESWQGLFVEGKYQQAARVARAHDSDASWAFAARATLAHAMTAPTPETNLIETYERAEADARQALRLNSSNLEASLQLAIALGHQAKLEGPWSPKAFDLAWSARRHIDRALAIAPEDPWANALLGAWRLTVSHHAGPLLAPVLFGTSWSEGKRDYLTALRHDPDNILLHVYFADALRLKSAEEDLTMMRGALQKAMQLKAGTSLEQAAQTWAASMLRELPLQQIELGGSPPGRRTKAAETVNPLLTPTRDGGGRSGR